LDYSVEEIEYLLQLSADLKKANKDGSEQQHLIGKNIVLLFEKTSTRTRCAFEVAAYDQGASVTYIGPGSSQMGAKESIKDTARVLGRMYDGIEYRGFAQSIVQELADFSGVPVWNGLTNEFHPTQVLADLLSMQEHSDKPLNEIKACYLGDARNNMGNSLLIGCAKMGMDFRIAAPSNLHPDSQLVSRAHAIADSSGANLFISEDMNVAVRDCDFLITDVWVSMGEPEDVWSKRIKQLQAYQINRELMDKTLNPDVKFMHCLPAFHNTETKVGAQIKEKFGIDSMEVTEEVFESEKSIVFDEAENRVHTIKAVMVATL
jgi:ornithine carbamoyltransferase